MGKYDDASIEFIRVADLDKRNLLVFPKLIDQGKSDDGKVYDRLTCDVVILDGLVTDLIVKTPEIYEVRFTSQLIVSNGRRVMGKGEGRAFGGKVNSGKGQNGGKAYVVAPWDENDPIRKLADEWFDIYQERRKAGKIENASNTSGDPFAEA